MRSAAILGALVALEATGCHLAVTGAMGAIQGYYSAGEFAREYGGRTHAVTRVGCIDVAASLRRYGLDDARVVLDLRMGNRCGDAVTVDASRIRVFAVPVDGPRTPASLFDPKDELHARAMGGRVAAFEPVLVHGITGKDGLCLDVSDLSVHEEEAASLLCFARRDDQWVVTPGGQS
jgi:hypothetical protein